MGAARVNKEPLSVRDAGLAIVAFCSHIADREVGADVFLANRVRSGRKQPQRDLHGSLPASYFRLLLTLFDGTGRGFPTRCGKKAKWLALIPHRLTIWF